MVQFDAKMQKFVARDEAGALLWLADLVIEDDRASHLWYPSVKVNPFHGKAGPWQVSVQTEVVATSLHTVRLDVSSAGKRQLRRILLRLEGGKGTTPLFNSSRSHIMALPGGGPFVDKGLINLGRLKEPLITSFIAVVNGVKGALLAAAGDLAEDFFSIKVDGNSLEAGFNPDRTIQKEEHYCIAIGTDADPLILLWRYGEYMRRFGRHKKPPVCGWNSWDYYGGAVGMDDIRAEMAAINASPLKGKLTHAIIDMGWWTDWGDFTTNRRFPASYRAIAKEIEAAGFVPGIWHAPLQASPWSYWGRHRQDLFCRAPKGGPLQVGGQGILDWTKPEVQQLLHDWFRSLYKAGFRYFKLDYIYHDAVSKMTQRDDMSIGLAQVIRNGLNIIREAVGAESYILNCGAARESSVGITDASRICTDTHSFWGHIWHNSREIACHLWEHGNLWHIDPDFAIIRAPGETTADAFPQYMYNRRPYTERNSFWMAGPEATFEEGKVWLSVIRMCGGEVVLSDSIARLNHLGLATLRKLFPPLKTAAKPLDLFVNPFPRFWLAEDGKRTELAVFNWDDAPSSIVVPSSINLPSGGVDLWTGRNIKVKESTVMAPRSAYILRV